MAALTAEMQRLQSGRWGVGGKLVTKHDGRHSFAPGLFLARPGYRHSSLTKRVCSCTVVCRSRKLLDRICQPCRLTNTHQGWLLGPYLLPYVYATRAEACGAWHPSAFLLRYSSCDGHTLAKGARHAHDQGRSGHARAWQERLQPPEGAQAKDGH